MNYFLTIAASDNSGGAGTQQDIKIAYSLNYWPLSVITAITVQNFSKVFEIFPIEPHLIYSQLSTCLSSFNISTIKIGAICNSENIKVIAKCLKNSNISNIVIDPVLISSDGTKFLNEEGINTLKNLLFPLAKIITPNKIEFELLTNQKISTIEEAIEIAKEYSKIWKTAILIKGGHFNTPKITEAIVTEEKVYRLEKNRLEFTYTHGTGCVFSTAFACFLGKNFSLKDAHLKASEFTDKFFTSLKNKL